MFSFNKMFKQKIFQQAEKLNFEDSFLERFIIRHGLQEYYERRNENYEVCLQFLEKFFALIDEYRTESKLNDDYIESHKNKRAYKKPRNRFSFKY